MESTGDIGIGFDKVGSGAMTFQPGDFYNFSQNCHVSNGTLNVSGGTLSLHNDLGGWEMEFGCNAGQNAVGTLSGGQLIADLQSVGGYGSGSFTQSGGTNTSATGV